MIDRIPGPPHLPLVGSAPYLFDPKDYADAYVARYVTGCARDAGMFSFWLGPFPYVEMFDPDTVAEVLGTRAPQGHRAG